MFGYRTAQKIEANTECLNIAIWKTSQSSECIAWHVCLSFTKTKIRRDASQYESSANTDSLTGSQYENCVERHKAQYEGEAACQGANPARGGTRPRNFDWIFCAGELRCGSPTGVTAHSSSATAGANQDHRAGLIRITILKDFGDKEGSWGLHRRWEMVELVSRCGLPDVWGGRVLLLVH